MASDQHIPSSPQDWIQTATQVLGKYPLDLDISEFLGSSASKVEHADWLLLRVCWVQATDRRPNHASIFGEEVGRIHERQSRRLVQSEEWWLALMSSMPGKAADPWSWGYMAAWRQTVEDIAAVYDLERNPQSELRAKYDESDPFRVRLVSAPGSRIILERKAKAFAQQKLLDQAKRAKEAERWDQEQLRATDPSGSRSQASSLRSSSPNEPGSQGVSAASHGSQDELVAKAGFYGSPKGGATVGSGSGSQGSFGAVIRARHIMNHRPDEALINMSLILLLQGVSTVLRKDANYRDYNWSILHKKFTVSQPGPGAGTRHDLLTAKTDGCLQFSPKGSTKPPESLAIVEVKPFQRFTNQSCSNAIQIQEGAEMAAWISSESATPGTLTFDPDKYSRVIISQDFDEVYITIAKYDDAYIHHIRGDNDKDFWPKQSPQDSPLRGRSREADGSLRAPGMSSSPQNRSRTRGGASSFAQQPQYLVPESSVHQFRDRSRSRVSGGNLDPPGLSSSQPQDQGRSHGADRAQQTSHVTNLAYRPAQTQPSAAVSASTGLRRSDRLRGPLPTPSAAPRPKTPSPPRAQELPPTPAAPQRTAENLGKNGTGGFLVMYQTKAFRLDRPKDVEELVLLLISLTKALCDSHMAMRFKLPARR